MEDHTRAAVDKVVEVVAVEGDIATLVVNVAEVV